MEIYRKKVNKYIINFLAVQILLGEIILTFLNKTRIIDL